MRSLAFTCGALALSAVVACGLDLSGTADVGGADDAGSADASSDRFVLPPLDGFGGGEASGDAVTDAIKPDGCGGPEVCTDGIDNDCNGLIDCADPACRSQGFGCTPAIPTGWSLVAFDPTTRPACPTGYGFSSDVFVDPTGAPAACACGCAATIPPSCVHGSFSSSYGMTSCNRQAPPLPTNDGTCVPAQGTNIDNYTSVDAVPAFGGACTPVPSQTVPALGVSGGRSCGVTSPVGGGCPGGLVCAPSVGSAFKACVAMPGDVTCAGGYTAKHVASALPPADTRGCSACGGCGTPTATCAAAALTLYTDGACTSGTALSFPANGMCVANMPSPRTFGSYRYSAQPQNAACALPPQPTPTGGVGFVSPETICCVP